LHQDFEDEMLNQTNETFGEPCFTEVT